MSDKNVCSSGWHGNHGSTVRLKNATNGPVTVYADSSCKWPFPEQSSPFTINAVPVDVKLADVPGTYCYDTKGCPNDKLDVNPKTVIID